jgi:hypothetical protein
MQLEIIYTFYGYRQQIIRRYPFIPIIARSKKTYLDYLFADLKREERASLIKVSSCIITCLQTPLSKNKKHWFNKGNGKIWVDELERYRKACQIQSSISPEYVKNWVSENRQFNGATRKEYITSKIK